MSQILNRSKASGVSFEAVTTPEPNLPKNDASGRFYGCFNLSGKQKSVNPRSAYFPTHGSDHAGFLHGVGVAGA